MKKSLSERFWPFVEVTDGCWIWTGSRGSTGYGQVSVDSRPRKSHRVAYELFFGPIPAGMLVCHHCDNRLCVRPDHLFVTDHLGNMRDMREKGRGKRSEETRRRMSEAGMGRKLPEYVKEILRLANTGRKASAETRAKMSTSQRARPAPSSETRAKIAKVATGRVMTAADRAKLSESAKRRWKSLEADNA